MSFNKVQVRKPSSSMFAQRHDVKLSLEMGKLVPFTVLEVMPGDAWKLRAESLVRFAPLVSPVMHSVGVHMHYFFVPNRLVWPNWEKFISPPTAQDAAAPPPSFPTMRDLNSAGLNGIGSLSDYLGLPAGTNIPSGAVSAIPFAAYQMIYNEYYRDQNLIPVPPNSSGTVQNSPWNSEIGLSNGVQSTSSGSGFPANRLTVLRTRAWQHDYFTAALPFAQKGTAVALPLGSYAQVVHNIEDRESSVAWPANLTAPNAELYVSAANRPDEIPSPPPEGTLWADMQSAGATATINDLRTAMRTQEFLERQARGGSRYIEQMRMQFGVKSSDARLQRPEFIGGTRNPVIISEVLQTSSSDETTPQATMAGHGLSASTGKTFRYYAEEHGYIIGIMSITPTTAYQQGVPRHFLRRDLYDFPWPVFAHIGEQEVYNKEIYFDSGDGQNDDTFGYVPRYSEMRYQPSRVAGAFRTTLAHWHIGRIFDNRPLLNQSFIECNPRNDIFAVTEAGNQNLWCHVFNDIKVRRKLPKYGTPRL